MTGKLRFSGIDWEEEEQRSKRGCADRQARKVKKKERKEADAMAAVIQARIREQVQNFLRFLSELDDNTRHNYLTNSPVVVATILGMYANGQDAQTAVDWFVGEFVAVDQADLNDWAVLRNLQTIMIHFGLAGLYNDPDIDAAPNAGDGELTSDSSEEH